MSEQPPVNQRQRLDKWLFFTRLTKSRSLAQKLIETGGVRVNGRPVQQPSHQVQPQDTVAISARERDLLVTVLLPGTRRGPFDEARLLYRDITPERPKPGTLDFAGQAVREPGAGRPTKRERRETDRLFNWNDD